MSNPALRVAPDLPVYLDDFPLPDRAPYSIAVDLGLIRSPVMTNAPHQRRLYRHMPEIFTLQFHMRTALLPLWQFWANETGYSWFYLPLASPYAADAGYRPDGTQPAGQISLHACRFISGLAIAMEGHDWLGVTVAAELSPDMFSRVGL